MVCAMDLISYRRVSLNSFFNRITVCKFPVNKFHRRGHVGYTTVTRESKPSIPKSMSKQASVPC